MDPAASAGTILTALALFAATNIDDIVLLSVWFANPRLTPRQIVVGQFLGIGALTAISGAAALAAIAIPEHWIALVGLVPLGLGLKQLWELRRSSDDDDDPNEAESRFESRSGSHVFAVAAVTVANGGDNLAAYVPVFAADLRAIPTIAIVFVVMTAVWCAIGYALVNNPIVGRHLQRYGHIVVPLVLIALGIAILSPLFR